MIYGLCDKTLLDRYEVTIEEYLSFCKKIDVKIVQYRDKVSSIDEVKEKLLEIGKNWDRKLIINDYVELANYCDGVHIGQEDLANYGNSIEKIRDIVGRDKIIGLSTHNREEILEANNFDLDYIGLGAYRATSTKEVKSIGGESLEEIAKLSKHPVAIIGGVKLDDKIRNVQYRVIGSAIFEEILKWR